MVTIAEGGNSGRKGVLVLRVSCQYFESRVSETEVTPRGVSNGLPAVRGNHRLLKADRGGRGMLPSSCSTLPGRINVGTIPECQQGSTLSASVCQGAHQSWRM